MSAGSGKNLTVGIPAAITNNARLIVGEFMEYLLTDLCCWHRFQAHRFLQGDELWRRDTPLRALLTALQLLTTNSS
jgi:hypothetical protein